MLFKILLLIIKKLVVFEGSGSAFCLVVLVKVVGVKKLHETQVNEVFHFPNPLANKGDPKLGANRALVGCHHKAKETALGNILVQTLLIDVSYDVLSDDRSFSHSVHTCLWREIWLMCVAFYCNAVTASEHIGMGG
jgi:hypothetical protein